MSRDVCTESALAVKDRQKCKRHVSKFPMLLISNPPWESVAQLVGRRSRDQMVWGLIPDLIMAWSLGQAP